MFGYVREYAPELKVKDYALYKSVYCGLCKSMGKCCGNCSRLTLSYDMTFLALFRMALEHTEYELKKERCIIHPFKKRAVMQKNGVLEYTAKVSALLSYAKAADDIADDKGLKRFACVLIKPFLAYAKKRAGNEELYAVISNKLDKLSECEREKCQSVDIPADIFGELTAEVFCFGLDGAERKIAYNVGFYTGKWIYAADALDDMKDDAKSGSYNPFVLLYGNTLPTGDAEIVKSAFMHSLTEIEKALDLVDFTDTSLKSLVYNILYEGMKRKAEEIAEKACADNTKGDKS